MGQVRGLQEELNLRSLVVCQPPEGVPTTRGLKITTHFEKLSAVRGSHFDREVVPLLEEKVHLERLYPSLPSAVCRYLIEVDPRKGKTVRVIPQTDPLTVSVLGVYKISAMLECTSIQCPLLLYLSREPYTVLAYPERIDRSEIPLNGRRFGLSQTYKGTWVCGARRSFYSVLSACYTRSFPFPSIL